ncbi:MAG: hypothetical protein ABI633_00915 [Burkholderiales bacterium]
MNSNIYNKADQMRSAARQKNGDYGNPELQGEGNYTASRRYRKYVDAFLETGQVIEAAKAAAPNTEAERRELKAAESEARSHARK